MGCAFLYENFVEAAAVEVSSFRPGVVGRAAAEAVGSAVCYGSGEHLGPKDQLFTIEIDSVAAGTQVGEATFRWRRDSDSSWQASGIPTVSQPVELADGVKVHWLPGPGQHFALGDRWSLLAVTPHGPGALVDWDRDSYWEATGCTSEYVEVDLGEAKVVEAAVVSDHNLSPAASVVLKASDTRDWQSPEWSLELDPTREQMLALPGVGRRYWRVEIADPDNPQGVVRLGGMYLGRAFRPSRGFSAGYTCATVAARGMVSTDAGKMSGWTRGLGQVVELVFPRLEEADVQGFEEMFRSVHQPATGRLKPVWFVGFVEEPAWILCCMLPPQLTRVARAQGRWDVRLQLREVPRTNA